MIPLHDPVRQHQLLGAEINDVVGAVVESGRWLDGPWTDKFASEFAAWCGVAHCALVGNGTDALELVLRAFDIGAGDEVITVANAGGFTTTACRLLGATPVWVDVRPDTLSLDPDRVAEAVGPRTRLVVATHLYGILADVDAVRSRLDAMGRGDIRIIEDCAQAHGAMRAGRRAGSLADAAAFSFYPTKPLGAVGDAGAVLTSDGELAARVGRLRQYGWDRRFHSVAPFGRNSRIDEIHAAVLAVKLRHADAWNSERRRILQRYVNELRPSCRIVGGEDPTNIAALAVAMTGDRTAIVGACAAAQIGTSVHYPILDCDHPSQRGLPGRKMPLPVSTGAGAEIVTLPCYAGMTEFEIDRVIDVVNQAGCHP